MGAFGAALIARKRSKNGDEGKSGVLGQNDLDSFSMETENAQCPGCTNHCRITIAKFSNGQRFVSGNRCERGEDIALDRETVKDKEKLPNIFDYKYKRTFDYKPLKLEDAPRGEIGIPRVLNQYENYPFWFTVLTKLGFRVLVSARSSHKLYEAGMETIPSESVCYPAKLAHGHIENLISRGIKTIFYPDVPYENVENGGSNNHYNCPIVCSYPEVIRNNVENLRELDINYINPFMPLDNLEAVARNLVKSFAFAAVSYEEAKAAVEAGAAEYGKYKEDIRAEGDRVLKEMKEKGLKGVVLAGRPYHIDPEINHGIPEMINSFGLAVLTEDSLTPDFTPSRPLRVNDQWSYHSRLYTAAEFVCRRTDLELIQINSFGCGLDAVTADQVAEILEQSGRLYTLLKIDEVSNLGAARIRLRSLIAASNARACETVPDESPKAYDRAVFTREMKDAGYTILAPQMSPIHFDLIGPVFRMFGYNVVILDNDNREAVETGLRCVNNDACYPSLIMTGQILNAVLSGRYDTDRLAVLMSQTGGCCRATNYIGFIRRALAREGLGHIPVISLNMNGMEKNPGFSVTLPMIVRGGAAIVLGDLMMKCLYRVRPYEREPGSADALHGRLRDECVALLLKKRFSAGGYRTLCRRIVRAFDELPIREGVKKPRVGIVGEILVKYMPLANNHLVELLESRGAEVVVPEFLDFFEYSAYGRNFRRKYLGGSRSATVKSNALIRVLETVRRPAEKALAASARFSPDTSIQSKARLAEKYLSLGNQYGEGWFLTGEMANFLETGVPNIVCIQPFGCLPNHVVGKGAVKALRRDHPEANIAAVDYDPGASQVNQLNRIELMLSAAVKALERGN
jgi:predicted nucleotide-binding protein (sugar kinase/HSP70/actin superfamily)